MRKIIQLLTSIIRNGLFGMLNSMCSAVDSTFKYLLKRQELKEKDEKNKETDNYNRDLRDACDKGKLDDLLKIFSVAVMFVNIVGCRNVEVVTTNQWEGHYFTVDEFKEGTKEINLSKKESIWVLSNDTLYKILKQKREN